ncbi:MAG: 4Fe-4S binding protein [Candidatus Omnitrophota bacterium]
MPKRKIIKIDQAKCNGCSLCIPNCPEGAIQMIDGKARLISGLFCDGLGACLGKCPQGAITIEEREAKGYDERKVMGNIIKQGTNVIKAHLTHLKEHHQMEYLHQAAGFLKEKGLPNPLLESSCKGHAPTSHSGCPGSKIMDFRKKEPAASVGKGEGRQISAESQLRQWPVQLMLVPAYAPYLNNADMLIAADCVPFAYASFHEGLLKGKILLVGCPKLDDLDAYRQKLTQMLNVNNIKSITYAHMEVPCCFGLVGIIQEAVTASGKGTPFKEVIISISGERLQ